MLLLCVCHLVVEERPIVASTFLRKAKENQQVGVSAALKIGYVRQ